MLQDLLPVWLAGLVNKEDVIMRSQANDLKDNTRDARLLAYSLVAGAAALQGAGQATDAAVEYFDIDDISIALGNSQTLYVNDDTQTDIVLKNYVFAYGFYQGVFIPYTGGRIMGTKPGGLIYATALAGGEEIGPSTISNYWSGSLAYGAANPYAEFNDVTDAYIGFSFPAAEGPDIFYAWVRVDINNASGTFVIKDFAFENTPGVAILAGDNTIPGDLNGDGFVGLDDLDIILNNWNQNVTVGDPLQGDVTGPGGEPDGYVGLDDLDVLLNNWNAGSLPAAAVPEPGALSLLAAGACGLTLWRRRR